MATMPGEQDFAGIPSARSGRAIAREDTSAISAGADALGRGIQAAGAAVAGAGEAYFRRKQQVETLRAETSFQNFVAAEKRRFLSDAENLAPGGGDFAESWVGTYDANARAVMEAIPADLRPDLDERLFATREGFFNDGYKLEQAEALRFANSEVATALDNSVLPRVQGARTEEELQQIIADGERVIAANYALSPAEVAQKQQEWRARAQTAFVQAQPAEERGRWLGTAPRIQYTNADATRNQPVTPQLEQVLNAAAVAAGVDEIRIFSGGQPAEGEGGDRVGSTRHDHGNAADLKLVVNGRVLNQDNPADLAIIQRFAAAAHAAGATGIGAGPGYMDSDSIHVGFGTEMVWGEDGSSANAPQWLRDAVENPEAGAGVPMRTALDGISYEDRVLLSQDASAETVRQRTAAAAAAKQEQEQRFNTLMTGILDGNAGYANVRAAREAGWLTDYDDIKKAQDAIAARDKAGIDTAGALTHLADPNYTFNPFDTATGGAVDQVDLAYTALGGPSALTDPEAAPAERATAVATLRGIVDRTDIVPAAALTALRGGIWSGNAEVRDVALSVLDGLDRANPEAVRRALNDEDWSRLQDYQALAPLLTPEELAARFSPTLDAEEVRREDALRAEAATVAKEITTVDVIGRLGQKLGLGAFITGAVAADSLLPIEADETIELRQDFENIFAERYAATGNRETAYTQAVDRLAQKWGYSDVGQDRRLVAYPPESQYPTLDGSHEWMKNDLRQTIDARYPGASMFGVVATAETEAALGTGQTPYRVVVVDQDGVIRSFTASFDFEAARAAVIDQFVAATIEARAAEDARVGQPRTDAGDALPVIQTSAPRTDAGEAVLAVQTGAPRTAVPSSNVAQETAAVSPTGPRASAGEAAPPVYTGRPRTAVPAGLPADRGDPTPADAPEIGRMTEAQSAIAVAGAAAGSDPVPAFAAAGNGVRAAAGAATAAPAQAVQTAASAASLALQAAHGLDATAPRGATNSAVLGAMESLMRVIDRAPAVDATIPAEAQRYVTQVEQAIAVAERAVRQAQATPRLAEVQTSLLQSRNTVQQNPAASMPVVAEAVTAARAAIQSNPAQAVQTFVQASELTLQALRVVGAQNPAIAQSREFETVSEAVMGLIEETGTHNMEDTAWAESVGQSTEQIVASATEIMSEVQRSQDSSPAVQIAQGVRQAEEATVRVARAVEVATASPIRAMDQIRPALETARQIATIAPVESARLVAQSIPVASAIVGRRPQYAIEVTAQAAETVIRVADGLATPAGAALDPALAQQFEPAVSMARQIATMAEDMSSANAPVLVDMGRAMASEIATQVRPELAGDQPAQPLGDVAVPATAPGAVLDEGGKPNYQDSNFSYLRLVSEYPTPEYFSEMIRYYRSIGATVTEDQLIDIVASFARKSPSEIRALVGR